MNIFFYSITGFVAAQGYLERLQNFQFFGKWWSSLQVHSFIPTRPSILRSGDLLIIFVADTVEINKLLRLKDEFVNFRVIVVLADSNTQAKAHALQPCFIAFQKEKMIKIEAVIRKITVRIDPL